VFTTINQNLSDGKVFAKSDDTVVMVKDNEIFYKDLEWIFHNGIGYVFIDSSKINISNRMESGYWWLISHQTSASKEEIQKKIFKLWIDHGKQPSDQKYEYIIIPETSVEQLENRKFNIEIIKNTPHVQAVMN